MVKMLISRHADSMNEESITIIENDLSNSKRDWLLRLREALDGQGVSQALFDDVICHFPNPCEFSS